VEGLYVVCEYLGRDAAAGGLAHAFLRVLDAGIGFICCDYKISTFGFFHQANRIKRSMGRGGRPLAAHAAVMPHHGLIPRSHGRVPLMQGLVPGVSPLVMTASGRGMPSQARVL
jgi:hypothetical protein